jgi:hypothetical protein
MDEGSISLKGTYLPKRKKRKKNPRKKKKRKQNGILRESSRFLTFF